MRGQGLTPFSKRVELDFTGIAEIGQAFADEMFRVFVAAPPEIRVTSE